MEIRLANNSDIPGMIELLKQVGQVHHEIRPDLFREGARLKPVRLPRRRDCRSALRSRFSFRLRWSTSARLYS